MVLSGESRKSKGLPVKRKNQVVNSHYRPRALYEKLKLQGKLTPQMQRALRVGTYKRRKPTRVKDSFGNIIFEHDDYRRGKKRKFKKL